MPISPAAWLGSILVAWAPAVFAQAADAAIPALGARITRVRFFEGGSTPPSPRDRQYSTRFDSATARSIYVEVGLAYPPAAKATALKIECGYTAPGSVLAGTAIIDVQADEGWELSVHAGKAGGDAPGGWRAGAYQVACRFDGKVIATGGFELARPPAAPVVGARPVRPEPKAAEAPAAFGGLRARVMGVRLFESAGGPVDPTKRVITTQFDALTTRYVNIELDLEYPKAVRKTEFEVRCRYEGSDSMVRAVAVKGTVEAGWVGSYHSGRWGSQERGTWPEGNYRVSCQEDGKVVATSEFKVLKSQPAVAALGAALTHLRLFHGVGERLPVEPRRYGSRFDSHTTRWVKVEFGLLYRPVAAPTAFTVECAYTFPDGTIRPVRVERRVPAGWTGSIHTQGVGWDQTGNWPVGSYRVSCRSDGREFGAAMFEVVDGGATGAGTQGATLVVFGRKGPIGGAPERRFVVGTFDSLFAEATVPPRAAGDSTIFRCSALDPLGAAAAFDLTGAVKNRAMIGTGRISFDPPMARGWYTVECGINGRVVATERFEMTGPPELPSLDARMIANGIFEGAEQPPDDEAISDVSYSAARIRSFWLVAMLDHPSDTGAGRFGYSCKITDARNTLISDGGPQVVTLVPGDRSIVLRTRLPLAAKQRWIPGRHTVSCASGGETILTTRLDLTR
jgi:hypothetical protein